MIRLRTLWVSLAAGVVFTGILAACATKEAGNDAALAAAPDNAVPGQCYWLSDAGEGWLARTDLSDPEFCYELDSCAGGAGLSGGGCYKWAGGADAPATAWTEFGFPSMAPPQPEVSGAQCYQQTSTGDPTWRLWGGSETKCYVMDACSGGWPARVPFGMCYKWAIGPDAPALPWSPALTNPSLAADIPPPEEIYESFGEQTSDSCYENCAIAPRRVTEATPLYARPDSTARIVGTLAPDECVGLKSFKMFVAPERGVVLEAHENLMPGDVIYDIGYMGEGEYTAWLRGEYLTLIYDTPVIRWDGPPATPDPRVGRWLELVRADGTSGWGREVEVDNVYTDDPDCAFLKN